MGSYLRDVWELIALIWRNHKMNIIFDGNTKDVTWTVKNLDFQQFYIIVERHRDLKGIFGKSEW